MPHSPMPDFAVRETTQSLSDRYLVTTRRIASSDAIVSHHACEVACKQRSHVNNADIFFQDACMTSY